MQEFINILIYFIAIIGIILTTVSFFDKYTYSDSLIYNKKIYKKKLENNKYVEIIVRTCNLSDEEIEKLVKIIKNGKYNNLTDIADNIKVSSVS